MLRFNLIGPKLNAQDSQIVDAEITNLLKKKVISPCTHAPGEVLSPVFTRKKKDGSNRMILNLKRLNTQVTYHHFKMETLRVALSLISKDCFMASVDLKDYYTVPIRSDYRKLLRFGWGMRSMNIMLFQMVWHWHLDSLFTKLLKPVFASLRQKGHISSSFLDDSLLLGNSAQECAANVLDTVSMFQKLGFVVHPKKSEFQPSKQLQYLGVIINSECMSVRLTQELIV